MTDNYDAIVVGGGHNGLICAALLARAGKSVLLLEANGQVGGAAITREFADGYTVSACAHLLYQLQPCVRKDLKLKPKLAADDMPTIALAEDGEHVRINGLAVDGVSDADAKSYREFQKRMARFAKLLNTYLNKTPPRLGTKNFKDLATLARLGFDVRRLGKQEMQEFLRLIGMNIHDEVTERFESPLLKGAISLDAVLGTHLGPRSPNTIMTYLYRLAGDFGRVSLAERRHGRGQRRAGARRARGRRDDSHRHAGQAHRRRQWPGHRRRDRWRRALQQLTRSCPTSTRNARLLDLVGARHLETNFTHRMHHLRARGNAAKLHLALDGLPTIAGLARKDLGARLVIAPDEHYVERAFNPAKYGESLAGAGARD